MSRSLSFHFKFLIAFIAMIWLEIMKMFHVVSHPPFASECFLAVITFECDGFLDGMTRFPIFPRFSFIGHVMFFRSLSFSKSLSLENSQIGFKFTFCDEVFENFRNFKSFRLGRKNSILKIE